MAGTNANDNLLREASCWYRVARRRKDQVLTEFYAARLDRLLDAKLRDRESAHA